MCIFLTHGIDTNYVSQCTSRPLKRHIPPTLQAKSLICVRAHIYIPTRTLLALAQYPQKEKAGEAYKERGNTCSQRYGSYVRT